METNGVGAPASVPDKERPNSLSVTKCNIRKKNSASSRSGRELRALAVNASQFHCEGAMSGDLVQLAVFAGGAFVAALVAGVSGFAFAPLAASVWLHLFTPLETAMLTVGYNILVHRTDTRGAAIRRRHTSSSRTMAQQAAVQDANLFAKQFAGQP